MTTADPLKGLVGLLSANADVANLTNNRIFGGSRSQKAVGKASVACIPVPGPDFNTVTANRLNVQVDCWGGTDPGGDSRAMEIARAVKDAVNINLVDVANVRIHWAMVTTSAGLRYDQETREPYATLFVDIVADAVTV